MVLVCDEGGGMMIAITIPMKLTLQCTIRNERFTMSNHNYD